MPKIDLAAIAAHKGSGYPAPFRAPCAERTRRRLADAGGLCDFGVNLMTLPPGGWSVSATGTATRTSSFMCLKGS